MGTALIGGLVERALVAWFILLAAILVLKMLRGRILLRGLVSGAPGDRAQGHRLQMMLVTSGVAVGYVVEALHSPAGGTMPDISEPVLFAVLGSQGVYLGGKLPDARPDRAD